MGEGPVGSSHRESSKSGQIKTCSENEAFTDRPNIDKSVGMGLLGCSKPIIHAPPVGFPVGFHSYHSCEVAGF